MDKPAVIKDKSTQAYIEYLEKRLQMFEESPYVGSYLTLHSQITNWNQQLTISDAKVKRVIGVDEAGQPVSIDMKAGVIDLFGHKDLKEFERAFKYFTEMTSLLKQLDETRKLMNPKQLEDAKKGEQKNTKDLSVLLAEKKNGG